MPATSENPSRTLDKSIDQQLELLGQELTAKMSRGRIAAIAKNGLEPHFLAELELQDPTTWDDFGPVKPTAGQVVDAIVAACIARAAS
jgi:hypothetical protein